MNMFDKRIKEMSQDMQTPTSYNKKVDELLRTLDKNETRSSKNKIGKRVFQLAVCLFCILLILSFHTFSVHADIFTFFKETIMDFLMGGSDDNPEDLGIGSDHRYAGSKPDLFIELTEKVIDSHSIYLLMKITAPGNIRFAPNITFDYFCFCKGTNYNVDQLISGAISCELLEINEDRPNIATYIVSLVFDEELEEDSDITACFRDLTLDPYSEHPTLLVNGVWSMTFQFQHTITDNIKIEGNSDTAFPYINTTATVKSLELTPLGMTLVSDVSNFPTDELGISDTTIAIRLEMMDGSEQIIVSHDPKDSDFVQGGSTFFWEADGKTYQQDTIQFTNVINISKVLGIYVENLYIPIKLNTP